MYEKKPIKVNDMGRRFSIEIPIQNDFENKKKMRFSFE